jgi:hypothetical protein
MSIQTAALVFGLVFAIIGFVGFFPSPPPVDAPALTMEHGHGLALGMFPVNTLHNIVHLLFAILGIAAWGSGRGRSYFRFLAVSYAILTVMGVAAATQTTFGLIPIWGNDVWLHGAVALAALYFGWVHGSEGIGHAPTLHRV